MRRRSVMVGQPAHQHEHQRQRHHHLDADSGPESVHHTITTVVTNSDPSDLVNPQLTATNSFTVIVIPFVLTGPTRLANGDFQFVFSTGAGVNYTIQYSTKLDGLDSHLQLHEPGRLVHCAGSQRKHRPLALLPCAS